MSEPTAPKILTITPLNLPLNIVGKGKKAHYSSNSISLMLAGDATYNQASGSGGWQVVDRPKRVAATQWFDRAPWSLSMECIINKSITESASNFYSTEETDSTNVSIENDCVNIESWLNAIPNTLEPPVFSITGPVPGVRHIWALYSLEFGEALRNSVTGFRYQQNVKLTFYEYNPPFGKLSSFYIWGPVETYNYNKKTGEDSFNTYVIKQGDTLNSIIRKHFPQIKDITRIQQLNNIRDPRNLTPGQTIIIPN